MEINFNQSDEVWDQFIDTSCHASVFVTSNFIKSLNVPYPFVTGLDKGGKPIIGCPIFFNDDGSPCLQNQFFTQYQGVIIRDLSCYVLSKRTRDEFLILDEFINVLAKQYPSFYCSQHYNFSDLRPFLWFNYELPDKSHFKMDLRYSAVIDLSDFQDFKHYYRLLENYRRKNKLSDVVYSTSEDVDVLNTLLDKSFERQGLKRDDFEKKRLASIMKRAIRENYGKICIAEVEGQAGSAIGYLKYKDTGYYLFAGNDPDYFKYKISDMLILHLIEECFATGVKYFDFVGANSPDRSRFKLSFNSHLKPFYNITLRDTI